MNKNVWIAALVAVCTISSAGVTQAASLKLPGASKLDSTATDKADSRDVKVSVVTKTEYKVDSQSVGKIKHEGKVYIDARADEFFTAEVGLNYETKNDNGKSTSADKWEMENVWLEYKASPDLAIRGGKQTYHVGKGLFIDQDGVFGAKATYKCDPHNMLEAFVGRDSKADEGADARLLQVVNWAHMFNSQNALGVFAARQGMVNNDTNRFIGAYGKLMVTPNSNVNFEFVRNSRNDKQGYIAEWQFGSAKKVGGTAISAAYMDVNANLFETNSYTDYDTQLAKLSQYGFRGPGIIIAKQMTKAAHLQAQRWWGHKTDSSDGSLPVTKLELIIHF